ncbi:putative 3-hydroxyisobutyrate dehydrogenase, mitochondrial [Drosera capensis]
MVICRVKSVYNLSKLYCCLQRSFLQATASRNFSSSGITSQIQNVGFIGLGNMGSRMAMNLIKSGYKVSVHDINTHAVKKLSDQGANVKEAPCQVSEASDVVITMLPSSDHVLNVYTGPNGLLQSENHLRPWLFIDSSTVDPQTSRKLSLAVSACDLQEIKDHLKNPVMLDAPVSGGVLAAEAGTLTFMVGGEEEAYMAAQPLFLSMGKSTIYCGGAGNGSVAKICNNLSLAVSMMGISEALALGRSLGISCRTLTTVFNSSSARCWSSDSYNPVPGVMQHVPSSNHYHGGFASRLMAKDLNLALTSAREVGAAHPLTSQAYEAFDKLCKEGHDTEDFSCVFRHYYGGKDE